MLCELTFELARATRRVYDRLSFAPGGVTAVLALSALAFACLCAGALARDPNPDYQFLLAGMKKEREALKSGVCRMVGRLLTQHNRDPKLDADGPLTLYYAFNGPDKLRYDRELPGLVMVPGSAVPDPNRPGGILHYEQQPGIIGQKYCKNGKRAARWVDTNSGQLVIDAKIHEPVPDAFGWWDVRAAGLYSSQMMIARAYDLQKILDTFADLDVKYGALRAVDKSDPNRWVVSYSNQAGPILAETTLSVDVNRGFTPVEYREHWRRESDPGIVQQLIKVSWEQKNGVWVPTHYDRQASPNAREWYDLHWESVNEHVDEKLFDYHSFGAPPQVNILDMSLGQPVLLEPTIGSTPPPPPAVGSTYGWKWKMIAAHIGILALVAAWTTWRFVRSRRIST